MKERPILFSAPMVRAVLAGRKTQVLFTVKLPRENPLGVLEPSVLDCKYKIGDTFWVKETFQPLAADDTNPRCDYKTGRGYKINYPATDGIVEYVDADDNLSDACVSSVHMPRWASRITLEVTGVRVKRLQSIDVDERTPALWHGNPWMWAISFRVVKP